MHGFMIVRPRLQGTARSAPAPAIQRVEFSTHVTPTFSVHSHIPVERCFALSRQAPPVPIISAPSPFRPSAVRKVNTMTVYGIPPECSFMRQRTVIWHQIQAFAKMQLVQLSCNQNPEALGILSALDGNCSALAGQLVSLEGIRREWGTKQLHNMCESTPLRSARTI